MGVSFLFLPTDFQALSFTSPRAAASPLLYFTTYFTTSQHLFDNKIPYAVDAAKRQNARIKNLMQAFHRCVMNGAI
jgi:hypothetical protein